jgi:hypothetical protein
MALTETSSFKNGSIKESDLDITNDGTDGQFLKRAGTQFTWDGAASYSTGTWTPTFSTASGSVGTYSRQVGRYTKIGRIVYCSMRIQAEDGDADGATSITGLPFTSVDSEHQYVGQPYVYMPGALTGQAHGKDILEAGLEVTNDSTSMKVYVSAAVNEDLFPHQLDFGVCSNSLYIRIWHNFFYEASS